METEKPEQMEMFKEYLKVDPSLTDFHRVTMELNGLDASKTVVEIDGVPIKGLQSIAVTLNAKTQIPQVEMVFIPRMVAVDIQGKSHILQRIPTEEPKEG